MKSFKDFINEQSYKMDTAGNIDFSILGNNIKNAVEKFKVKIIKDKKINDLCYYILDVVDIYAAVCVKDDIIVSGITFDVLKIKGNTIPSIRVSKTHEDYRGQKLGLSLYEFIIDIFGCVSNDKENTQASINVYKKLSKKYKVFILDLNTQETYRLKNDFDENIEKLIWVEKPGDETLDKQYRAKYLRILICK